MTCPAPIGRIPTEDCGAVANEFGELSVQAQGALSLAGAGTYGERRVAAIREAAALATSVKDQRVKLCEAYVKCTMPLAEHDQQDQKLTAAMRALLDAWSKRRFSGLDGVVRFREAVRGIDLRLAGGADVAALAPPPQAPRSFKANEALGRIEDPGVAFRVESGSVTVSATAEGKRDALLSKAEALPLLAGHRYRVKLIGSYKPATPPLLQPGDDLLARVRYHVDAGGAADLTLALRSLEDPDAAETTERWHAAPGETKTHEAKLSADPQETGFYLGVGVKGAGVTFEDVELLRGGKVLLTAKPGEPGVKTDCTASAAKTLHCQPGEGDRITLGQPEGFLVITLRDATGPRATTRTVSLEGGRSLDAALGDGAELLITLVGAGSATLQTLEVTDLGI